MEIDAQTLINVLRQQVADLSYQNAVLQAQIIKLQTPEVSNAKSDNGNG